MNNNNSNVKSLSTKIIFSFTVISIFLIIAVFAVFENINKKAFYNIEIEKANIIAKTIEPLIALNICSCSFPNCTIRGDKQMRFNLKYIFL